ncbi:peptidoglycan-binding protein [Streptomyces sp. uw30]|uniref:peptidoglycan-binding domain-containing protein n=1 Tax=Streptomyces sp. uw30 TaxID=1828179 RepID=UPI0011CD3806|nr:peptidoglycan-binding domain-containing protein [Streptomyces sp. uw30]TXS50451.1 peptidoglycan-binding protein [Streptomyces sp. uw30]
MRPNIWTRTLVSVSAVVGLAAAGLATAGTSSAASDARPAVRSDVGVLAVNNLGLSNTEARYVQCWIQDYWGYTGALDGQLGTNSWKALQRWLKAHWGYNDNIDGIVGPNTIKALQRDLKAHHGYTGAIDGIAGSGTKAAFKDFAADSRQYC